MAITDVLPTWGPPPLYQWSSTPVIQEVPGAVDVGGWYITLEDVRYIDVREPEMATVHFGGRFGYAGFDCLDVVGAAEVYALLTAYRAHHGMEPPEEPEAESEPDASPDPEPDYQEMRERLAAYAHEAWSGWMRYMLGKCHYVGEQGAEDSMVIPGPLVERWHRQMTTDYANLPEGEKESDRAEADKMLAIVGLAPDEPEGAAV